MAIKASRPFFNLTMLICHSIWGVVSDCGSWLLYRPALIVLYSGIRWLPPNCCHLRYTVWMLYMNMKITITAASAMYYGPARAACGYI